MRAKSDLRTYQDRTANLMYESDHLLAVLPMGAGKTATGWTVIQEWIRDGVVRGGVILAPKRVAQLVWPKEVTLWAHLQGMRFALVAGTAKQRLRELSRTDVDVWIVGIDNTQWLLETIADWPRDHPIFGFLMIDEMSRFKAPRGKRGKSLAEFSHNWLIRQGLTGTPRPNGYRDLFMPARILVGSKLWGRSYDAWLKKYFISDYNGFNFEVNPFAEAALFAEAASFQWTMSADDMPELPPLTIVDHEIDLPATARTHYERMLKELIAQVENDEVVAANMAVASGKLCQCSNGFFYRTDEATGKRETVPIHDEKIDLLEDLVEGAGGEPVMIVYGYEEDLTRIYERFGKVPTFGAGTTDRQAAQYESDWNAGNIPILALHPASAGHGLNLQESGTQMIFYDLPWSAELFEQTYKRFWRPGQTRRCFLHRIIARNTVDEVRVARVDGKIDDQEAFRRMLRTV